MGGCCQGVPKIVSTWSLQPWATGTMLTAGIFSPRHGHVRGQLQNKDLHLPKWLWIQMSNFVNWNINGLTKLRSLLKFTEKGWSQQSFDVTVSGVRCHKSNIATYLKFAVWSVATCHKDQSCIEELKVIANHSKLPNRERGGTHLKTFIMSRNNM